LRGAYAPVIGLFQEQARRGEPLTIVGDGTQRRDFTHVDDVVEANMCALNNTLSGIAVNIGTGTNYSVNEIAAMISDNVTYIAPRKGEAHETLADNTKARNMLGWEPTIDLRSQLSNV